ncbi:hypothetical protein [uncultured Methanobrevibacter sp.]|uniref:hypothetical protein n=1 Tax=uncultured Methanobrevibacter sp. TaxID=253161 RepID=UPI0025D9EB95|nr:hypothetical protein [uncultured Methanobrevibacter sp.]
MGNTIKLVSGFILFVIGVLIAYETSVYNLLDILLIVGLIISIVGIILIVSYFVEYNADRTTNMLKDFLKSDEMNAPRFNKLNRKSKENRNSLRVQRNYDDYDDGGYDDLVLDDYRESDTSQYLRDDYVYDDTKSVLNIAPQEEAEVNFDRQLEFTPHYGKPMKVTRSPKRRSGSYFVEEVPQFVEENDKSDEIIKVLSEPEEEPIVPQHGVVDTQTQVAPEVAQNRDIKIDVNNPESLPVPKALKSCIISDTGLLSSQEAFDQLAINVNKEIMLEIPSLTDLSDRFLSHVPTIYSRVIIDEFDVSDMSYMFLISSLLKQGVHIKTVPKVHSVNLITDDSYAMIISEGPDEFEYGAIYDDRISISNIRADFEKTWNIASNLDENIIIDAIGGAA